jgi:Lrp/AsnC family transcriptional regulator, leucine-responsive regulatory protein
MTGRTPLRGLLDVTTPLPAEPVRLDDVDRRLLTLLAADARASQRKLARDLHMSPPAVGERIARLERLGVVRGYTVDVDWTALGYFSVFVTVTAVQGADQAVILQALRRLPEVEAIVVITGSIDMLARLRVRSHAHLRQVLLSEVWRIDGVQRTETFIALAEMPTKEGYVGELLALRHTEEREADGAPGPATGRRRTDHPIRPVEETR